MADNADVSEVAETDRERLSLLLLPLYKNTQLFTSSSIYKLAANVSLLYLFEIECELKCKLPPSITVRDQSVVHLKIIK